MPISVKVALLCLLACMCALTAMSAVAGAEPATVTVRVEGATETLLPPTVVTTTTTPVVKDGNSADACPGEDALGALELATGGGWSGKWESSYKEYVVETILGESHPFSGTSYWEFWFDNAYSHVGACNRTLKNGDTIVFFPECSAGECPARPTPLAIEAPGTATVGSPVTVTVTSYTNPSGSASPAAGATVTYEGHTAVTDAAGHATFEFSAAGARLVKVSKPGSIRTEATICVTEPGATDCTAPHPTGAPSTAGTSGVAGFTTTANGLDGIAATLTKPKNGRVYRPGHAPQLIVGRISSTSPVVSVSLSLRRSAGHRCYSYDARRGRFRRARCGVATPFLVSKEAGFSYFLPNRLAPGRYVLEVHAVDAAGTRLKAVRGSSVVVFHVR